MSRFTRTKCDCKNCPLQDRERVRGISGADSFKVAIIGEAPGEEEDQKGEPFVGSAGHKLKEAVASAGLIWHLVYKTNVLLCRPPDNDIDSIEGQLAIKCCMPGFKEEVAWMEKNGTKVLVPTGNTSMNALGIEGKIGKYRGSVFEVGKMIAVPTYHPSFILRGMWKEEPTWINDLAKARDLSLKKWSKPKENFNLFPTEKDVKDFVENAIEKDLLVACDLETTSLNEYFAKILMVGLAINGEDAIVVPFTKKGGTDYWSVTAYSRIWKLLDKLFVNCKTMFQNASYDCLILETNGHHVKRLSEDTMLLHHCISPELPHKLGYIVSVYGKTPYWKDVVLGSEDKMIAMDDAEVRTYNARDTVVLHQVLPELLQHVREVGTEHIYREVSMRLVYPLMRMHRNGMLIDQVKLKKKAKLFEKKAEKAKKALFELCNLPEGFNLDSPDHMRLLVHGTQPKSYETVKAKLDAYKTNKRLRTDTKVYQNLSTRWHVFNETEPLCFSNGERLLQLTKEPGTDALTMLMVQRKALLGLNALSKLKNRTERVVEKIEAYTKIKKFIEIHREFAEAHILATTFSGFPLGPDKRVHIPFKIHGTVTGRLSSGADEEEEDDQKVNGQNIPEEVQDIFIASPGRKIVKWDYSNIEYRVIAMFTKETDLEERFNKGENFHDLNTTLLFGITKDDPNWDVCRRAAKTFIFGLSYGGTTNGIYNKILVKVPDMDLTLSQFSKIVENYFLSRPLYKSWREEIIKQATTTRCIETAFGRKRFLLGMPQDIERQALNTPSQGTAGEVTLRSLIDFDEILLKKFPDTMLIDTVHDSIIGDVPEKDALAVAKLGKKIMERPFKLFGREVRFPVDTEIGPSWGETKKVDL
jgi:uracil-DNA glycosylase family 4